MKRKLIYLIVFSFFINGVFSQYKITGVLKPKGSYQTILLYKMEGAFQYYKANASISENGIFTIEMPENLDVGSYKIVYEAQKDLAVNVFYNKKDISFIFNPEDVINSIYFLKSEENTIFYDYVKTLNLHYDELRQIKKTYYLDKTKKIEKTYNSKLEEINGFQKYFEEKSEGKIIKHFIKAYKKPSSKKPLASKIENYLYQKEHFLDAINFQDTVLINSSFLIDRLIEYIFDLNEVIAKYTNTELDVNMISFALNKIEESKFKKEAVYSITSSAFDPYSSRYDVLLDYVYNNYYQKLPEDFKNEKFTTMVKEKLNAIVGKKATDIEIGDSSMYSIKADSLLVIFWSTTCSHCLKEIPEVYKLLSNNKKLEVVIVGLEESYSDWENVIKSFPNWKHVRANGKWTNKYAKAYNVKGTPAYFLLNEDKIIIEKPDNLKEIKQLFEK